MKVGILGAGRLAKSLAVALTKAGYSVMIGARDLQKAQSLAGTMERFAQAGTLANTIHYAPILILAIPYKAVPEVLTHADDYHGKILIDCTNPLVWRDGLAELALKGETSAAEQIAKMAPQAKVVKAFNTAFTELIEQGPFFGPVDGSMFFCGDDLEAKSAVAELIKATHFEPVDAGPLESARLLEAMAALIIRLGTHQGLGREIAFKLLKRS